MATNDKYDRQLRLWGSNGQKLLSQTHLLVLGSSTVATETLKNLVLPGIGRFTIVDSSIVSETDISCNFFVDQDSVGKSRAQVTCDLLCELNPDVSGNFIASKKTPCEWFLDLDQNELRESNFGLIIAANISEAQLLEIERKCDECKIHTPIMCLHAIGFFGECRIVSGAHCVIESKPSPAPVADIRLADPFPELLSFALRLDVENMDNKQYKHIPYVLLLLRYAQQWQKEHTNTLPSSTAEKKEFKEGIRKLARQPWGIEENVMDAYKYAYLAYTPKHIPDQVQRILNSPMPLPNDFEDMFNKKFWILMRALKEFVANRHDHKLPLHGVLPDMTSSTELYVELQDLYRRQANHDLEEIKTKVHSIQKEMHFSDDFISDDEIQIFCKHAYDLEFFETRKLADAYSNTSHAKAKLVEQFVESVEEHGASSPLLPYVMRRAYDHFVHTKGDVPNASNKQDLFDICSKDILDLESSGLYKDLLLQFAEEFIGYQGCELHNIAAFIGGVGAQEAVKLVTHQYVILNNTYLFNGITCVGSAFEI